MLGALQTSLGNILFIENIIQGPQPVSFPFGKFSIGFPTSNTNILVRICILTLICLFNLSLTTQFLPMILGFHAFRSTPLLPNYAVMVITGKLLRSRIEIFSNLDFGGTP